MGIPNCDPEANADWLRRLRSLNQQVLSAHEPLMGNVCYQNNQPDFLESPPLPKLRAKRDRIRAAVAGRARLLEVGVNGGHSAYVALSSNPELEYYGVDVCASTYVERAITWLKGEFPNRVFFHRGDSTTVLPALAKQGCRFDVFHIDGATHLYYTDIVNASRMAAKGSVVILDDALEWGARVAVRSLLLFGTLEEHDAFPPIDRYQPTKRVLRLHPSSPGKYGLLSTYGAALDVTHRLRMTRFGRAAVPKARDIPLR